MELGVLTQHSEDWSPWILTLSDQLFVHPLMALSVFKLRTVLLVT